MAKKSNLKTIIIKTINNVYKHIHLSQKTFEKKYQSKGKFPNDKRKNVYQKKAFFYNRENVPQNIRRIKQRDAKGWKSSGENYKKYQKDYYPKYKEAVYEQKKRIKEREAEEKKEKAKPQKEKYIRVWMKLSYKGKNPLFIEAFITGKLAEESSLKRELREFIASNFNEEVMYSGEIGTESIKEREQTSSPQINYKHSSTGAWQSL